jgi:glycosyltransferase involved in cell wall biosynthesis
MKVLLVHNSYQSSGGEDIVFSQEKDLLLQGGHNVITYVRSNWEAAQVSGVKLVQLAQNTVWSRDARAAIKELLQREKPDLVHVHNTFMMMSPSIYSACRAAGVPVVQTLHNYRLYCPAATFFRDGHVCEECVDQGLWRSLAHGCYRESRAATSTVAAMLIVHRRLGTWTRDVDCYVALSEFSRSRFLRAGLPANKILVKPNFVDPDPGEDQSPERQYALFVGRLSAERTRTLLNAWDLLRGNNIQLVIVGGGPNLEAVRADVVARNLPNVTVMGELSRQQTLDAMRRACFLVFSSEWYENFPVTIIESFACKVPVICSCIGAMKEIVDHGRTGLHFEVGNAADLAEKVRWAWEHKELMEAMGEEARLEFKSRYTAKQNYTALMRIYRQVLSQQISAEETLLTHSSEAAPQTAALQDKA